MSPRRKLYGLKKIVIIESTRHHYLEVELGESTQFVAGNGKGKTSLLNTLQFLYILDRNRWQIGHPTKDTVNFYFPPDRHRRAYIVFECDTAVGMTIIGMRRSTPGSDEITYFSAGCPYSLDDFIDQGRGCVARDWDDVRAKLALHGLRSPLSRDERRDLLVGNGKEKGWRLVPLLDNGSYEKFSEAFLRLLRLHDAKQSDLKEQLIRFAGVMENEEFVNLKERHGEEILQILTEQEKVQRLLSLKKEIEATFEAYEDSVRYSAALNRLGSWITQKHAAFSEDSTRKERELLEQLSGLNDQQTALKIEIERLDGVISALDGELGSARAKVKDAEEKRSAIALLDETLLQSQYEKLQRDISEIEGRLGVAAHFGGEEQQTSAQLERDKNELKRLIEEREKFGGMLVNWLRRQRFDDEEIAILAALFNPSLLREEAEVLDEEALGKQLEGVIANYRRTNSHSSSFIRLPHRLDTTVASKLASPDRISEEIERKQKIITKAENLIKLLKDSSTDRENLAKLKRELREVDTTLKQLADAKAAMTQVPGLVNAIDELITRKNEEWARRDQLRSQREAKADALQGLRSKIEQVKHERESLSAEVTALPYVPAQTEKPIREIPLAEDDLSGLLRAFRSIERDYRETQRKWTDGRSVLEERLGEQYVGRGSSQREQNNLLREELDAQAAKGEGLERKTTGVIAGARGSVQRVLKALETIETRARELSRDLGNVSISGISRMSLVVERNAPMIREFQDLMGIQEGYSLFNDPNTVRKAFELIRLKGEIRLADLFNVAIVIEQPGQPQRRISSFVAHNQAGSTGQIATMKVLFSLIVMRRYFEKDTACLPFYVDEILSLDLPNRKELLKTANELGFRGIFAATEAAQGFDKYYSFADGDAGERVTVTAKHAQILEPRNAPAG